MTCIGEQQKGLSTYPLPPTPTAGGTSSVELTVPQNWQEAEKVHAKRSYHASGVMHVQANGSGAAAASDVRLVRPEEISGPTFLEMMITKPPAKFEPYTRSLTRHQSSAIVLSVPEEDWNARQYLELFLAPSGEIQWPRPLLKVAEGFSDTPVYHSLDIEMDRLLAVRWIPLPPSEWDQSDEPMVSFSLLPAKRSGPYTGAIAHDRKFCQSGQ
ncbi:MAG: hypothetical protein WAW17_17035 [Rhodococcus sp. (in: high G+C Gram-positive bacteria)]|uniref:hypothetical protein n=1 Tax=Rhodococcus sp. TaxID=1831 RepID=UPI003BAE9411